MDYRISTGGISVSKRQRQLFDRLKIQFRYMEPLIEHGHLYIAQPPLYRVQTGKDVKWVYSDDEKDSLVKRADGKYWNVPVTSYPNVSQFWKYDPETYIKQPPYSRTFQGIKKA